MMPTTRLMVGIDDVVDVAGVVALQDPHGDAVVGVEARHALCRRQRSHEQEAERDLQRPTDM